MGAGQDGEAEAVEGRPLAVVGRMRARRRDEAHRVSTPLELFFDLSFAAAVAQAGQQLATPGSTGWGR